MLDEIKKKLVFAAKEAEKAGMCRHKSGNFSIYDPESGYFAITPSGIGRDVLKREQICVMDLSGKVIERALGVKPSSEALMHLSIYKERLDLRAIVHTHAWFSTAFAVINRPIPPIVYECANVDRLGVIPVAPYGRPGSRDLAEKVAKVMKEHDCCLLQAHGAVAAGRDMDDAFLRAQYVEEIAKMYYIALTAGGGKEPPVLPAKELENWSYPTEIIL